MTTPLDPKKTLELSLPRAEGRPKTTSENQVVPREIAQLVMLLGGTEGRTYVVEEQAEIGRQAGCSIHLSDDDASRRHARIRRTDRGFMIEDLGSRNGTFVNGLPIKHQQTLKIGDRIRIGAKTLMMFTRYDRLQDQLQQAQKMESIGHLAGGVAHDFNNLLGAILANLTYLQGLKSYAGPDVQGCLADTVTATQRATELTQQLLSFARRRSGESHRVDISTLIREVCQLVTRTFSRSIAIEEEVPTNLAVIGDSGQLHQVLMNLCINARDAMPDGGTLTLSSKLLTLGEDSSEHPLLTPGPYVLLAVSDTGVGMSPETLRRVFEPFFTTKGPDHGSGMGLAVAYGIVKRHGGYITAESRPGAGAAFRVYLPAAAEKYETAERPRPQKTRGYEHGLVLVVEDEPLFRQSARRLLENQGHGVLCASDGVEAVELFKQHHDMIKVVLLDMIMPNLGGTETFHELRRIDPSVRIVLNTGRGDLAAVRPLLDAGASGCLQKPYDAATLTEAIAAALRDR
jgi:two-component system, cell cycle sensor histidine kinase and response regulator CckA